MALGFIAGAFDLLHVGHLHVLRFARNNCDRLIVGLHIDPSIERDEKEKPVQSVFERYCQLMACRYVDEVVPYETEHDLLNLLCTTKIDVRFLGSEYEHGKPITGKDLHKIVYVQRNHSYSSSILRHKLRERWEEK